MPKEKTVPKSGSQKKSKNANTNDESSKVSMMTQVEHVRKRSGMYLGGIDTVIEKRWIMYENDGKLKAEKNEVEYNEGLYQTCYELIVNASDHTQRCVGSDNEVTKIEVDITSDTFTVKNNGKGISLDKNEDHTSLYNPEIIFGHLLSSTNYDDEEKRLVGGLNGLGAKLSVIFSKEFSIELVTNEVKYVQTFHVEEDLKDIKRTTPVITKSKVKDYTKITYKPDFSLFKMKSFDDNDTIFMIKTLVYNCSAITNKNVKVYLNGEQIAIKNFKDYVTTYLKATENSNKEEESSVSSVTGGKVIEYKTDRWEVYFALNPFDEPTQISFVNGLFLEKGTHINYVFDPVIKKVVADLEKSPKCKDLTIKGQYIKDRVIVFVNCLIENVTFDSQKKTNLSTKSDKFGSKCIVSDDVIKKITKLGFVEELIEFAKSKELQKLDKTSGSKRTRIDVKGLHDANYAGTKKSGECVLILAEGDSALSSCISGLGKDRKNFFGAFPLRGKLLNVRGASIKKLTENEELNDLNKILGLVHGQKDKKQLRYGKIMIMCDSDHDGFHIKGLIMNYIQLFWEDIFEDDFICTLITPVVKVTTPNKKIIPFYSMNEFDSWKAETNEEIISKSKIKYYKELGTSNTKEAEDWFNNMEKNRIEYVYRRKSIAQIHGISI